MERATVIGSRTWKRAGSGTGGEHQGAARARPRKADISFQVESP